MELKSERSSTELRGAELVASAKTSTETMRVKAEGGRLGIEVGRKSVDRLVGGVVCCKEKREREVEVSPSRDNVDTGDGGKR